MVTPVDSYELRPIPNSAVERNALRDLLNEVVMKVLSQQLAKSPSSQKKLAHHHHHRHHHHHHHHETNPPSHSDDSEPDMEPETEMEMEHEDELPPLPTPSEVHETLKEKSGISQAPEDSKPLPPSPLLHLLPSPTKEGEVPIHAPQNPPLDVSSASVKSPTTPSFDLLEERHHTASPTASLSEVLFFPFSFKTHKFFIRKFIQTPIFPREIANFPSFPTFTAVPFP